LNGAKVRAAELRRLLAVLDSDRRAIHLLVTEAAVAADWSDDPPAVQVAGVALAIHHLYTAAEHSFEKIAELLDRTAFKGQVWHRELLHSLALPVPGVRDRVLAEETLTALDEFRAFRHVVRHAYEYRLNPERVKSLASRLPLVGDLLDRDLASFSEELKRRIIALESDQV